MSDPMAFQARSRKMAGPYARACRWPGLLVPLMLGAAICWPGGARASETSPGIEGDVFSRNAFSIQGFGTLGAARSSNGKVGVPRNVSQPEGIGKHWSAKQDSLLGLQMQYSFSDQLNAQIQAASYYRSDGSFKPTVTAAFLKYDLNPRFSVRLGRVGLDLLMLSDTRMVGYSYIPIRPASEFFSVPVNFVDGINARWRAPLGEGVLSIDGTAGIAQEDIHLYEFGDSKVGKASIGYESGPWQFRYFYTRAKMAHDMPSLGLLRGYLSMVPSTYPSQAARVVDKLVIKDTKAVYESLGVGYDDGDWQMQLIYSRMRYETPVLMNPRTINMFIGRRLGNVTPYIGYSRVKSKAKHLETGLSSSPFFPGSPDLQQLDAAV
ncbi:MAG: hypothetical protein LBU46_00375, partial [Candidatus Accumulibacter sp.]|nr:hypothetical protein [Accumulibacter sp.]